MKDFATILEAAAQLTGDERRAYLERVCEGDQVLRQRLEDRLNVGQRADRFFGENETSSEGCDTQQDPIPEAIGNQIGHYKLREKIGEGGCGVVYVAEQEEPVRRRVALKIIKLGMDTRSVIARFEAERQALAIMDHPNIAKVLDGGSTESGRPYFVMELVRGVKITDYCDQHHLSTRGRLNLFVQVCQAVQHAHQKGIIHRDLKPSNILVTLHDGVPVPKVIDFGIAKATEGRLTNATVYTELHQFIGTPAYMSPEQAEMSGLDIDTRSDIYSLGVLLYELLTGKTPFEPKDLLEAGFDAMRRTIREVEPSRPSTRLSTMQAGDLTTTAKRRSADARRLVNLVRGDLDWIVMKALEKDRTRRYETATSFAADIQRHLQNEPVIARPPSAIYKLSKAVRRNRLAYGAAAAVAAALIAGAVLSNLQATRAKRAEALANARLREVVAERDAKEQARKDAEQISKFLQELLQSPAPGRDGRTVTVAELLDRAAKRLETELKDQPDRRAQFQKALAAAYNGLGLYSRAIALQEDVRGYSQAKEGLESPETINVMADLGWFYTQGGRLQEAQKLREEVLTLSRKVFGAEHPSTILAQANVAGTYFEQRRFDEALQIREEVLRLSRKVNGPEHPHTIWAMLYLAGSYQYAGRLDEARELQEQSVFVSTKVFGREHPTTLDALKGLANTYYHARRLEDARKLQEELLEASRKVNGPEHRDTIGAIMNLANTYRAAGRAEEALKLRQETLELSRRAYGPEHPLTIDSLHNLATSYAAARRYDEALELAKERLALNKKLKGLEHPDIIVATVNLAISYGQAGRGDEAFQTYEEALALCRKIYGAEHPETISFMQKSGTSYFKMGRKLAARKLREDVLALSQKVNGADDLTTVMAMIHLAMSYYDAGEKEQALSLREQALTVSRKTNGPEHPVTLMAMADLAGSYHEADRNQEALKLREEVLALTRKAGSESPAVIRAMGNLAISYNDVGRKEEALRLQEDTLALSRKLNGPEHPDTIISLGNLADSYAEAGRKTEEAKLREELARRSPISKAP